MGHKMLFFFKSESNFLLEDALLIYSFVRHNREVKGVCAFHQWEELREDQVLGIMSRASTRLPLCNALDADVSVNKVFLSTL